MTHCPITTLPRRRFIQLAASFGAAAMLPTSLSAATTPQLAKWQGIALGAEAQITLAHPNRTKAQAVIEECVNEIARLESIFSLYQPNSVISQLNAHKHLNNPPPELIEVITSANAYSIKSNGLFDVTIQPLWALYHQHFQQESAAVQGPADADIAQILPYVDYRKITFNAEHIAIQKPMAITLNGIAQGYITDRIAALLTKHGYNNPLVNLVDNQAIGLHPSGRQWQIGVPAASQPWKIAKKHSIPAGKALATSGGYGTQWSAQAHHLLSPHTGRPVPHTPASITIIANTAMDADVQATIAALTPHASSLS
ncbi:MAG: FAD:protein FMN transferase [Alphaproteobacteria bacterium]|nr:FAD:protein FMN transferase [Alphaproteobacteria bacterium]